MPEVTIKIQCWTEGLVTVEEQKHNRIGVHPSPEGCSAILPHQSAFKTCSCIETSMTKVDHRHMDSAPLLSNTHFF